ncbi:hypothetical protein P7K49_009603 [Saguinus oedipus]|uniref:Agouti-signaling protein n=6 Tax=Boreoeutheria TaxID=1437010 RepID=A0ABQ9VKU1_SAGOE|nr:hypothetical protein P7K49_009603 [Saguinus oedipus]
MSIALRPPGMDVTRLLLATLLVFLCFFAAYSHLPPEEKLRDDRSLRSNSSVNLLDLPSVSIVGLNKKSKKISRKEAEKKRSSKERKQQATAAVSKTAPAESYSRNSSAAFHAEKAGHWGSEVKMDQRGRQGPNVKRWYVITGLPGGPFSAGEWTLREPEQKWGEDSGLAHSSSNGSANKQKVARPRTPLSVPCVSTRGSCKPPAPACCHPCASCQCRFFRSACSCHVLNVNC